MNMQPAAPPGQEGKGASIRLSPKQAWVPFAYWLPAAALMLPAAMLVLAGWLTWREAMAEAFQQMIRTAEATAEYADRAFESYVVTAGRVNDRLRGLTDAEIRGLEEALHQDLRALVAESTTASLAYAIDRRGVALVGTLAHPVPQRSLADREYFLPLMPPDRPAVVITPLLRGRDTGQLQFAVARPRTGSGEGPDAQGFEGVVIVTVNPDTLAANIRRLTVAPDYAALVLPDGQTIARTVGLLTALGPIPPQNPFHAVSARGETSATFIGVNRSDGSPVLTALRRLDNFPVYAVALRPREAVVAAWRETMLFHLLFGVPATLALFTLSLLVSQSQMKLAEGNVALRLDARRAETRLSRAERMGLIGMFEIDFRTGENFRSAEYMAVQGLPAWRSMARSEERV